MKTSLIVKINFLLLGLGLTIYVMYQIQMHGLNKGFLAFFGLSNSTSVTQTYSSNININLCQTRVKSMTLLTGKKIVQEGQNWVEEGQARRVVDFLAVEKWLAQNCKVPAKRVEAKVGKGFTDYLQIEFINGVRDVLSRNADGMYIWQDQKFRSQALDAALSLLNKLPDGRKH